MNRNNNLNGKYILVLQNRYDLNCHYVILSTTKQVFVNVDIASDLLIPFQLRFIIYYILVDRELDGRSEMSRVEAVYGWPY